MPTQRPLKIVLMIAYFRDEEIHPGSLAKRHTYSASMDDLNQAIPFASTSALRVGQSYTSLELIRAMIIDSDNGAKDVLLEDANDETVAQVYKDLKIPDPAALPAGGYTISPREYSLFFRILYNATYLDRSLSEKAMEILGEARFADGLIGGLPKGVTVAHKYGEHVNGDGGAVTSVELHDCGVVYGPNLPYFLCVMTTGKDVPGLTRTIQDISRAVYDSVDLNPQKNP
jgi:beta-lactamase class A